MTKKQFLFMVCTLLAAAAVARAQGTPAAEKQNVPTAVQVVFSEYEGEKKVSSLPYTIPVNARSGGPIRPAFVRMGIQVPVNAGDKIQYMDIGTNIDCQVEIEGPGQFAVHVGVERTSIYSRGEDQRPVEWSTTDPLAIASRPIIRSYRTQMTLLMKDGQTVQRSVATDPLSGRVLKVDVTLSVVK